LRQFNLLAKLKRFFFQPWLDRRKRRKFYTTSRSCRPRGAVMIYDTLGCSFAASEVNEGISCKITKSMRNQSGFRNLLRYIKF
jgi:hypothetical protein